MMSLLIVTRVFDVMRVNRVFFPFFISLNIEIEANQDHNVAGQLECQVTITTPNLTRLHRL